MQKIFASILKIWTSELYLSALSESTVILAFNGLLVSSIDALRNQGINVSFRAHFGNVKTYNFINKGDSEQSKSFHYVKIRQGYRSYPGYDG